MNKYTLGYSFENADALDFEDADDKKREKFDQEVDDLYDLFKIDEL